MIERKKKKKEIAEDDLLRRLFTEALKAEASESEITLTAKERAALVDALVESHGDAVMHLAWSAAHLALALTVDDEEADEDEDEDEDE
ncbi:MAG: hypothetical protein EBS90_10405, partial [Betaproteobacteria bacterium]|nr:hypothetical protein [Betaproteobacteria bacterium]